MMQRRSFLAAMVAALAIPHLPEAQAIARPVDVDATVTIIPPPSRNPFANMRMEFYNTPEMWPKPGRAPLKFTLTGISDISMHMATPALYLVGSKYDTGDLDQFSQLAFDYSNEDGMNHLQNWIARNPSTVANADLYTETGEKIVEFAGIYITMSSMQFVNGDTGLNVFRGMAEFSCGSYRIDRASLVQAYQQPAAA